VTNFYLSYFRKSCITTRILLRREGRTRGRHDTWGGDAVDVTALASVILHADEQGGCGREVVWSWHPGADAKLATMLAHRADDGGNQAGPRGDHV
jgi:hypothetical protein